MIDVNWRALIEVTLVTFLGGLLVVTIVSLAAALLQSSYLATEAGKARSAFHTLEAWLSIVLFLIVIGIVGFGFYLLVPWWH